jgi:hypothetical protein
MAGCFKTYFAQADIEYTKVTHVRKLGIIRAHQMGADRENIILLSKHTVHKVDNSYLPELPYQAMLAAAGFDIYTRQEYFVPRTYAQVPPEWIGRIFPYIDTWKIQVNETWGYDKGKAAKSFVNCLLPHLAQIVLQDGMYLATAYPKHTYAKILLQKVHNSGYESWCCEMKEKVLQRELALQEALNEDRRYDAMLRTTEHTVQRILSIDNSLSTLPQQFIHLRNFMEKWQHNPITTPQNSRTTLNAISEVTPVNLEANAFRTTIDDFPIPNGIRTGLNVTPNTHCIQGIPIIPCIPTNVHSTIRENIEYWISHKYYTYMERNGISLHQLGWPRTLQQRFCKRRDIALWVKTVGEKALGMTLDWKSDQYELLRIASVLDEERGKKTVMVALEEFKSENELSWKKGRKKK